MQRLISWYEKSNKARICTRIFTDVLEKKTLSVVRNHYVCAHYNSADLSLLEDFNLFKDLVSIVRKSFVSIRTPVKLYNSNIYLRDTILLAPAGMNSLEKLGTLYAGDFEKIPLSKSDLENMRGLLIRDKNLFEKYAMRDKIITLKHAVAMEMFNLKIKLVQMIKNNVDVRVAGTLVSSLFLYKADVILYLKSTHGQGGLPIEQISGARTREIALFMIMGAPVVVGALMTINAVSGVINIAANTELEGTVSNKESSSSSFFLFLNKLPSWIKTVLKYIAFYFLITFITSVIGYNNNIIEVVGAQFYLYLVFFLKLYTILNFLVVIYFMIRLYIIKMFAYNKDYINPETYNFLIKRELLELKEIAIKLNPIELDKFYKRYYFLICLYTSIVLLGLTAFVLASVYLIPQI